MLPINFEGARWIGKPPSMTDEECYGMPAKQGTVVSGEQIREWFGKWLSEVSLKIPLSEEEFHEILRSAFAHAFSHFQAVSFFGIPAYHFMDQANYPQWLTAWKPNVDDLKALNEGGAIWIRSLHEGLVPMAVFTLNQEKQETNDL